MIARDSEALVVAERDGEIIGALVVGWDGWRCHVYRMAIAEGDRRLGIASALFDEALRRARKHGTSRIDAMVDESNAVAFEFWKSRGFNLDINDRRWSFLLEPEHDHLQTDGPSE